MFYAFYVLRKMNEKKQFAGRVCSQIVYDKSICIGAQAKLKKFVNL